MGSFLLLGFVMVAAALAAIPAAMICKRIGLSVYWAIGAFLILTIAPFTPNFVVTYLPSSLVANLPLPVLGGLLKVIEWLPGLIFLWVVALRALPKARKRAQAREAGNA
jgi:hypothetical protein